MAKNKDITTISSQKAATNYDSVASKKPEFSYDDSDVRKSYDALMKRKDFTFDVNTNALYNQMKDVYQKQGNLAMQDTMGQAAAMTGGYGSSYAVSAGAQAYQQNLDKLNERVPELYELAMQQYQLEGQNLWDKYSAATTEREAAYGRHRDNTADWQWETGHAYDIYGDAVSHEQAVAEFAYQKSQDKLYYDLAVDELGEKIRQFDLQYGLDSEKFKMQCEQWAKEYGLDADTLAETIRMNNWKLEQDGRSG